MEEIEKQVRRAHRRLGWRRFAAVLGWCWFGALMIALGLIVADRFYPLGAVVWQRAAGTLGLTAAVAAPLCWTASALLAGLAVAGVWIAATQHRTLAAALEIDSRYGLKERVSTTLAMEDAERQTQIGQALAEDATRRVGRIDVGERFALRPPRSLLLPLAPALLAVLIAVQFGQAVVTPPPAKDPQAQAGEDRVKKPASALRRRLAERRKRAEKEGLKEAEKFITKLEEGTKDLAAGQTSRKKALAKLNNLTRQLQDRRKQLGGADRLQNQLNRLGDVGQGPAKQFADALSRGKFQEAAAALDKLKDQLDKGDLTPEKKKELGEQLGKMKDKIEQLAKDHEDAKKDLQDRVDDLRKSGKNADADKLAEQLKQLSDQAPQMDDLSDLADQLGKCAECLGKGQLGEAGEALGDLQGKLGDLQAQLDDMEMLDDLMNELGQARSQMGCPNCQGAGCGACQGDKPGMGMGQGRGQGARPEAEDNVGMYDSKAPQQFQKDGEFVVKGTTDGPNIAGDPKEAIQVQVESFRQGSADPLTGHRLPRKHRDHSAEYFDRFREGE
ncbi:MAG: hypothetical protein HQ567_23495 [Candidatus Nealsonbacteria bacterium]|nr:hypothetical protein [Candidatus Nealsonbacteria bacterium]